MNQSSLGDQLNTPKSTPATVVWSNDDISFGKAPQLSRQLAFLDRYGICGVFFVIPSPGGSYREPDDGSREMDLDRDPELVKVIREAKERGHEFYPHGYRHHAYECGFPELDMLMAGPLEVRDDFDQYRLEIEAQHSLPAMMTMLDCAREVWLRAFGEEPIGFRPGWGAYCQNLYTALAESGYEWVSSRLPSMSAYQSANGGRICSAGFRSPIPCGPHRLESGIWEFPIMGDYSYRVPNDRKSIALSLDLASSEITTLSQEGHPVVLVTHWHGLEYLGDTPEEGTGYAVQSQLVQRLLEGGSRFIGMKDLAGSLAGKSGC